MADAYSYALAVELEENSEPKLKNKLVKYFQSRKSNGGDCVVEYVNGSKTATLRFRSEEDRRKVLEKEAHQISLDKGVLKMKVRVPTFDKSPQEAASDKVSAKSGDVAGANKQSRTDVHTPATEVKTEGKDGEDETRDEEVCSTSVVIANYKEKLGQQVLEMLVENVLRDYDPQNFTYEFLPDISSAVVTFQSGKETTDFVTRCPQNRTFKTMGLSVQPLEVTTQIIVEDLRNFNEPLLRLYFENAGGDVEDVALNPVEQSATITFNDHKAVQKIMKKKHKIGQEEIRVYPFYKSLETALYGKDKPSPKLPAAISEPIDCSVWKYLSDNQSATETIHSHMAKHFCDVNLKHSSVCLTPVCSLLEQKDANTLIKDWRDTVKSAFAQALSRFRSLKLHVESELWDETEKKITEALVKEGVVVVPDKASGVFSVVGLVNDVNRLEQILHTAIDRIAKKMQREKLSTFQEIKVSQSVFNILCQDGFQDRLLRIYPELKLSFRQNSPDLVLTGLNNEIMAATKLIYDAVFALKRQNLEIDKYVLDLLKDEQPEELTNGLLISNGLNAALEMSGNRVQLLAVTDKDLNDAEDHLVKMLISRYIDAEDGNVLKKPEWKNLVSQLENVSNQSSRRIKIHTSGQKVVVSGHRDDVISVSSELDVFLNQNSHVEEIVVVKPDVIVGYIKELDTSSWLGRLNDKVLVSYKKEGICLRGARVDVTDCKTLVNNLVSAVFFDSLNVSMPGVKKFFQSNQSMHVSSIMRDTGCLVQLVDEGCDGHGHRQVPRPVYQIQTPDGVEVAVCKADMCSYPVHAVVSPSNEDLKHDGGLAGALFNAAGPQLQDECNKQISGKLKPGDCVITSAGGGLCCTKVIHAVRPRNDPAKPQKTKAQLKRAVKGSLEMAENHGCVSVALPVISKDLGFQLSHCAVIIIKAVKEYYDEKSDDITLKKIHFVDIDDGAVKAMEQAVRQEYGDHGVSNPHPTTPPKPIVLPSAKHAAFSLNFLGHAQTKEGLGITLIKGNIQDATTEVIVNTVFEDLILTKGAVSNAILGVAGPKLQQLVHAKQTSGKIGEVIVTEGCNLNSKHVFHAVTPQWHKGQGEKTLCGIFKDCLDKAEQSGLTSISFPAMGTGNLGFPKDLAASLMLDEILAFSSQSQPKHLKRIVIILYPGDASTVSVFSDEFQKKFPNASGGPVSTSSSQSTALFSKVVSSSGMYETKMGNVVIQAVTGDITKETTDVIVNSSNETFTLKSGVSKAILEAAGFAVEEECQDLGAQPNTGMIMTQPGKLKCKTILHLSGQQDPVRINQVVKDALQMCMTNAYTSVSFPAIGTGQGNAQAKQVADAMLDAVADVVSQNASSSLNTIRIVIFQPPMLNEFYKSMQQREAKDTKEKGGSWLGTQFNRFKAFIVGSSEKPKKTGDVVIESVKVEPACFHICGDSQDKVALAKQQISQLLSQEQEIMPIKDNAILSFSEADCQRIVNIQRTMSVSIEKGTDDKTGKAIIVIKGLTKDVFRANKEILQMIGQVRDEEEKKRKVDLMDSIAEWQYRQQGSTQFQSFDPETNYELEKAFDDEIPSVTVTIQGQNYNVHMPNGPAIDDQGSVLEINRIDKVKDAELPQEWDTMPLNTPSQAFPVTAGTPEYITVETLFSTTCAKTILKIERIQNPALWKSLQVKKVDMERRNGHQNNEQRLFHGTCHDTVPLINEHGFNRSYAGKNATAYGNGTYFALEAKYSARDTYSKPNQQTGEKLMYLCRVLTGEYTAGKQDMIAPPTKDTNGIQKYDSVVDDENNPKIFVIFHDSQAYPEYLITFK